MREARIKVDPNVAEAVYHWISRAVAREQLFDATVREIIRRQLWLAAEFCGVQVITYTILSMKTVCTCRLTHAASRGPRGRGPSRG